MTQSKSIQRRTGRTFHVATRLLPADVRDATYVLYAFFRMADDVVDDPDPAPANEQLAELERIREAVLGERPTDDPVLRAFEEMRRAHDISADEIDAFLDAMRVDVDDDAGSNSTVVFENPETRETYLRGSAVAVAYMMVAVMDPDRPDEARPHARALGEAFQLTNFLRDVREDLEDYDRIYLPQTTLDRFDVDLGQLRSGRHSPALAAAIRYEMRVAEERYRTGVAGIQLLPQGCQFAVLVAAVLYAEYHRLIRRRHFDVISGKPRLTPMRFALLLARTALHWRLTGDPEATFYRVSPIFSTKDRYAGRGTRHRFRHAVGRMATHIRTGWFG